MTRRSEFEGGETGSNAVVLESLLGQQDVRQSLSVGAAIAEAPGAAWLVGVPASRSAANVRESDPARTSGGLVYLAPEAFGRASVEMDGRADLYSLGVTLYELATGKLPFAAHAPGEWVHAHLALRPIAPGEQRPMPPMVERILLKLLEKDPLTQALERLRAAGFATREVPVNALVSSARYEGQNVEFSAGHAGWNGQARRGHRLAPGHRRIRRHGS